MKNENYYIVHGWMMNELHLKGSELVLYAIIYGFTQDGRTEFRGGHKYLADMTEMSQEGVRIALKSLCDKGVLKKTAYLGRTNGLTAVIPQNVKPRKTAKKVTRSYDIGEVEQMAMTGEIKYDRKRKNRNC